MTHEQKIQFIADKCAVANPRLKELGFGMKLRYKDDDFFYVSGGMQGLYTIWNVAYSAIHVQPSQVEIIGREPQLADALMAVDKALPLGMWDVDYFADDDDHEEDSWLERVVEMWNLSLGLYNQSPETIDFLYQLLSK